MPAAEKSEKSPSVIVGVDGSIESDLALRWGRYLGRVMGAPVVATIAWTHTGDWAPVVPAEATKHWHPRYHAEDVVRDAVERALGDDAPEDLRTVTTEGGAGKVLVAATKGAALIVLGSRGKGGFRGLKMGSVSVAVSNHAQCPVLIVHRGEEPPG